MMNVDFTPEPPSGRHKSPKYNNGFTAISHFFGRVQGEFILSNDESTAAKIAGVYHPDDARETIIKNRELFSGMMCEILNVSAHQSLTGLINEYGRVVVLPPSWVFGEYHMASVVTGVGIIDSLYGSIQCCVALNLAGMHDR